MGIFTRLIASLLGNIVGVLAAARFISGVAFTGGVRDIIAIAGVLTALHLVLRPIVKMLLGPLIILTLGLGIIAVNALMLFILDTISENLTIETIPALIYATLVVSAVNIVSHLILRQRR